MQALKGLVAGLGILIVIAMSVIGYGLYRKSIDPGFKFFTSAEPVIAPSPGDTVIPTLPAQVVAPALAPTLSGFGEIMVGLPQECAMEGVSGDGARIYLRIGPGTPTCSRVIVLNAATGAQIGVIRIAP